MLAPESVTKCTMGSANPLLSGPTAVITTCIDPPFVASSDKACCSSSRLVTARWHARAAPAQISETRNLMTHSVEAPRRPVTRQLIERFREIVGDEGMLCEASDLLVYE